MKERLWYESRMDVVKNFYYLDTNHLGPETSRFNGYGADRDPTVL
jgi:hypothetical protein